ncbi:MAG: twin-arginine translocation signal domain-containing protein, partial [Pirellulales bacterium]|nr:twin-arginine translocation signal domain-containing protein [Pirellulales bacterium]
MQHSQQLWNLTRRHFLGRSTAGIGAAALGQLLAGDGVAAASQDGAQIAQPLAAKLPPLPAKARNVIYLHMAGSPPQQELFDYKPKLQQYNNK